MHSLRILVGLVVSLSLVGCGSSETVIPIMPDVAGQSLDIALSDIERAGIDHEIEILGGGMFGVLEEANWQVCDQLPTAGQEVVSTPRLTVARSCDAGPEGESEALAKESEEPEPEPSVSESEQALPAPDVSESDSEDPVPDASDPERPGGIDAEAMEAAFVEGLYNNTIEGIGEMCDDAYTHWACFYDGVESVSDYLQVNLSTDGGWSRAALRDMADTAGRHWFNFIGCDFPGLSTIVVTINGLDHNVFRRDTMVDSICN